MSSEAGADEARCWCGNVDLAGFLATYARCAECGTLISLRGLSTDEVEVRDDDRDFYGREYWFARQRDELGLPDIHERARLDLPERCLYWLRALLGYALPPARVLDLGSGPGAFVALLRWVGFDASGLELSPWVVDFARKAFGIPMRGGLLETQGLPEDSFDVIVLNDVLEHVVNPLELMQQCARLLSPHGFVVVQTPCYPDPQTHDELVRAEHPVLAMLQEREHLHLFSQRSVRQLFNRVGLETVQFEPALFPYDMFLLASRAPLVPTETAARDESLLRSPSARLVRALIDLDDKTRALSAQVLRIEQDRQERIQTIERLNHHIDRTRTDYDARLKTILDQQAIIGRVSQDLERVSVDYEARLRVIFDQQGTIDRLSQDMTRLSHHLERINIDYEARLKVILDQQATIDRLSQGIERASEDNEARLKVILDGQATIDQQQAAIDQQQATIDQQHVTIARLGHEANRERDERQRALEERARVIAELTAQGQTQLAVIARQQATVETLHEGERRRAGEMETRLSNVERRQDAIARTRLVRLLRHLRIL